MTFQKINGSLAKQIGEMIICPGGAEWGARRGDYKVAWGGDL